MTSLIFFADTDYGSRKLLRSCLAILISSMYLSALCLARHFKMATDLYLACTSNLMLICCFVSGIVIKLCEQSNCYMLVGVFHDSVTATAGIGLLAVLMLICKFVTIAYQIAFAQFPATLRVASTGREPELSLPAKCEFHGFMSHGARHTSSS